MGLTQEEVKYGSSVLPRKTLRGECLLTIALRARALVMKLLGEWRQQGGHSEVEPKRLERFGSA